MFKFGNTRGERAEGVLGPVQREAGAWCQAPRSAPGPLLSAGRAWIFSSLIDQTLQSFIIFHLGNI